MIPAEPAQLHPTHYTPRVFPRGCFFLCRAAGPLPSSPEGEDGRGVILSGGAAAAEGSCPATRVSLSFAPKERYQRKRHQGGEDFVFSPSLDPPSFKRPNGACEPLLDFPGNTNPVSLWGAGVLDSPLSSRRRGGITMRQPKPSPHTGKGDRWRWMRSPRSGLRIHLRRVRWGGRRALSHLKVFTTVLSQCLRNILRIV